MTGAEIVLRALHARGRDILYSLGHGGFHPEDDLPTRSKVCDCSGFVSWALGVCRQCPDPAFPWYETTAIVHDTLGDGRHFDHVRWADAQPGDVVVYGDRKDKDGSRHQGHIGIVTAIDTTGPLKVIHCSHGASVATGDAITETSPDLWRRRGIVARHKEWVT
jgi:cell wall-associated NlpC family hydrolase